MFAYYLATTPKCENVYSVGKRNVVEALWIKHIHEIKLKKKWNKKGDSCLGDNKGGIYL